MVCKKEQRSPSPRICRHDQKCATAQEWTKIPAAKSIQRRNEQKSTARRNEQKSTRCSNGMNNNPRNKKDLLRRNDQKSTQQNSYNAEQKNPLRRNEQKSTQQTQHNAGICRNPLGVAHICAWVSSSCRPLGYVRSRVSVMSIAAVRPRRGKQRASAWRPGTGHMNILISKSPTPSSSLHSSYDISNM